MPRSQFLKRDFKIIFLQSNLLPGVIRKKNIEGNVKHLLKIFMRWSTSFSFCSALGS